MGHDAYHKNTSGYSIQTAIALVLFIVGLMLLVVWAILYANRLSNNLPAEWWIWLFLGFGVGLMVVGLIWLIIVQYMVGSKAQEMYEHICHIEHDKMLMERGEEKSLMTPPASRSVTTRKTVGGSFAHNE